MLNWKCLHAIFNSYSLRLAPGREIIIELRACHCQMDFDNYWGKKDLLDEAFAVDIWEKDAKENRVGSSGLMSSQRLCCAEIRIVITD